MEPSLKKYLEDNYPIVSEEEFNELPKVAGPAPNDYDGYKNRMTNARFIATEAYEYFVVNEKTPDKNPMLKNLLKFKKQIRETISNYMSSEGCSCCRNVKAHKEHEGRLAKLLGVKKYPDGSGYNFSQHKTPKS